MKHYLDSELISEIIGKETNNHIVPNDDVLDFIQCELDAEFDHVRDLINYIEDPHDEYGIVLEYFSKEKKDWEPSEIIDRGILYHKIDSDAYTEAELRVGLYANWGDCWGDCEGDDWEDRCGVSEEFPTGDEPVHGETTCTYYPHQWYRLRRVKIGPFSQKAKDWMYANLSKFYRD